MYIYPCGLCTIFVFDVKIKNVFRIIILIKMYAKSNKTLGDPKQNKIRGKHINRFPLPLGQISQFLTKIHTLWTIV